MAEVLERNSRKERVGTVVSNKMEKTIVVAVVNKYKHPLYKKTVSDQTLIVPASAMAVISSSV